MSPEEQERREAQRQDAFVACGVAFSTAFFDLLPPTPLPAAEVDEAFQRNVMVPNGSLRSLFEDWDVSYGGGTTHRNFAWMAREGLREVAALTSDERMGLTISELAASSAMVSFKNLRRCEDCPSCRAQLPEN